MSDTKHELEQRIRECAYFLWERDGCPDGYADKYWDRASEIEAERAWEDRRVDIEAEDSFPASDPPSRGGITGDDVPPRP